MTFQARNANNPTVNIVQPEVAAVTRAQLKEVQKPVQSKTKPATKWIRLKQEAASITKELTKTKPQILEIQEPVVCEVSEKKESKPVKKWIRKLTGNPEVATTKIQDSESESELKEGTNLKNQGTEQSNPRQLWQTVTERVTKLSLELSKLAEALPVVEEMLEKEGLKTAYELNKTSIRDDQAPVVPVEYKIRKHWKPIEMATLDGGAGVNIMSERVRKYLGLQYKPAPFKLRMANQAISEPLGMVEDVPIRVAGVKFEASFLILDVGNCYDMLLGRPWLRTAGAVHDWGTDELTMNLGTRKITISTLTTEVPKESRPGDIFVSEPQELWKKLAESNIVPIDTLDLNR